MLTTAAWPEASRNRWPSPAIIQQPSPRDAMGKVFLKLRGKSPPRAGMRCPGKDCSRVKNSVSTIGTNLSHGEAQASTRARLLESEEKRDIIRRAARDGSARPDSAFGIAIHCVSQEMKRDERRHFAVHFCERVTARIRAGHFRTGIGETSDYV